MLSHQTAGLDPADKSAVRLHQRLRGWPPERQGLSAHALQLVPLSFSGFLGDAATVPAISSGFELASGAQRATHGEAIGWARLRL